MKNIYCPISQEVVETGFKPITLVLHKVLSIKLLDHKIHLFSRTDVVQILLHLRSNLTFFMEIKSGASVGLEPTTA